MKSPKKIDPELVHTCRRCGILDWAAKKNPELKCYNGKEHKFNEQ